MGAWIPSSRSGAQRSCSSDSSPRPIGSRPTARQRIAWSRWGRRRSSGSHSSAPSRARRCRPEDRRARSAGARRGGADLSRGAGGRGDSARTRRGRGAVVDQGRPAHALDRVRRRITDRAHGRRRDRHRAGLPRAHRSLAAADGSERALPPTGCGRSCTGSPSSTPSSRRSGCSPASRSTSSRAGRWTKSRAARRAGCGGGLGALQAPHGLRSMTRRMVHAIANPHVDVLGHCTGRLITGPGTRPESTFDAEIVFEACRRFDVAVEINSRPERRDPPTRLLELAMETGCLFAVDTDAHAPRPAGLPRLRLRPGRRARDPAGSDRQHDDRDRPARLDARLTGPGTRVQP